MKETIQTQKKYIRAKEVASIYGIGLSTVWLYAKNGRLTPKKISERVTVFSVAELEELFNSDEVAS
ncbi:DNA-binding protein [Sulfurimonas sediminis]|uniref:DNA-binding protein n=1 Tax=Sulfurimonas sediminis TaxID=2590020 RepID=A0A7M1B025_9BACT|nr:helix-turn-helix domain-containing protein [Sulfurimonas sediminis]QOP42985.1 DNA-binding protein [Sulfurimonas sediminis]